MTESTQTQATTAQEAAEQRHRARVFDIRTFIALLIGLYGVVLVLTGLFATSEADLRRAGGLNINLSAGIGMVVVAAAFLLWARLRPVMVPDADGADDRG
jgi:uncharacterized membrane protein